MLPNSYLLHKSVTLILVHKLITAFKVQYICTGGGGGGGGDVVHPACNIAVVY